MVDRTDARASGASTNPWGRVSGRTLFTDDVLSTEALHAAFVLSSEPHARICSIDTSEALAMPGVFAAITGADVGDWRFGRRVRDYPVLAIDRVLFAGQRVAAVAAWDAETARQAADRIHVEYEPLDAVLDPHEALRPDAPVLHPDYERYENAHTDRPHHNVQGRMEATEGRGSDAFAEAEEIHEHTFRWTRSHSAPLEPHACLVVAGATEVHVYSSHKEPYRLRRDVALLTGGPEEDVIVHPVLIGGDFGAKGVPYIEGACYFLSVRTGRPVRTSMTYFEELTSTGARHPGSMRLRTGLRDGVPLAHENETVFDGGAFAALKPQPVTIVAAVGIPSHPYQPPHRSESAVAVQCVLAIDQGTTSTRAVIVDPAGAVVSMAQKEHQQIFPRPGWVEHDPLEISANAHDVVVDALGTAGLDASELAAVGISNQRETTVVWDRTTGEPVTNAIVWQDTRTRPTIEKLGALGGGADRYRASVGLPLATYFAGPKVSWILDSVDGARTRAEDGDLLFGTIDSWLLWNLAGGVHVTDVTNASRTMLMNLDTLTWNADIATEMGIPMSMLPEIRSSSEVYGTGAAGGVLSGVPVAGVLGDQQAATFGQACYQVGAAKNTYGTGNFMLLNTGETVVSSEHGLLTTVCYKIGDAAPVYALEGSIAVTGALVQWLRDNLGLITSADEIEPLAASVDDNGGAYFVPAFSGLFAPYWRADARGALVGLTRYVTKGHLARAVLEATAFQTREVLEAMNADSGVELTELRVDGGMVHNELLMQFQADILNVPVVRPKVAETTALGAAYAAGLAVGYWSGMDELQSKWTEDRRWVPRLDAEERERAYRNWTKAVTKTFDWVDADVQ